MRVLDFGVARHAGARSEDSLDEDAGLPQLVLSRMLGTPLYMAPEQRQRGALIDGRADQFAFAVTCWELLYGQRPFPGENVRQYLESAANGRFRSPPAGTKTPTRVHAALVRALSFTPSARFASMDDLLAALSADPARRWRQVALIAGALAATAATTVAIASRQGAAEPCEHAGRYLVGVWDGETAARLDAAFRATGASFAAATADKVRSALDRRATAWTAMHREACRATRVTGEQSAALLDLRMGCLDRRRVELDALVKQLLASPDVARVAAAVEAVERLPAVDACADREALTAVVPRPVDAARRTVIDEVRAELATIEALVWTGQWSKGRARAEQAHARATSLGWAPLTAETSFVRGLTERHAGSLAAAETALTEAVRAAARAHLDDLAVTAWSELAWLVGYEQSRPLEGLALATAAETAALRADGEPLALAEVAHTRALIHSGTGDQAAALREAERALAIYTTSSESSSLAAADVRNTIAMVVSEQGDYRRAEQLHREVLAQREAILGDGHPKVADSLDNLGVVVFHQGRHAEARRLYEQALALRVAILGPAHRDVGTSHNNLGALFVQTGDDLAATEHLDAALRIYEATLGREHADLAIPLTNLGELAERRGDHARAIEACTRALAIDEAARGPDDPQLAFDLVCLGEAHLGAGDARRAREILERAVRLRESTNSDEAELARARSALARTLR